MTRPTFCCTNWKRSVRPLPPCTTTWRGSRANRRKPSACWRRRRTLRGRFNHRQAALLNHALRNTGESYRVDAHQRSHAVVYQTARRDLLELEELGLLEKTKQGNAYIFYAPADLRERLNTLSKSST